MATTLGMNAAKLWYVSKLAKLCHISGVSLSLESKEYKESELSFRRVSFLICLIWKNSLYKYLKELPTLALMEILDTFHIYLEGYLKRNVLSFYIIFNQIQIFWLLRLGFLSGCMCKNKTSSGLRILSWGWGNQPFEVLCQLLVYCAFCVCI